VSVSVGVSEGAGAVTVVGGGCELEDALEVSDRGGFHAGRDECGIEWVFWVGWCLGLIWRSLGFWV